MTKKDKIRQKLLERPGSVSYMELEMVLLDLGFLKIEAKGSHRKFKHHTLKNDVIIPLHNGECKEFYKKHVSKIIKKNF